MAQKLIFLYFLFLFFILTNCTQNQSGEKAPLASKGLIDLRGWDFNKSGSVSLKGEWEFYWKKFIQSSDSLNLIGSEKSYVQVPGPWNNFIHQGQQVRSYGYASYKLTVLLDQKHPNLSMKLLSFGTAYRLYINGKARATNGRIGRSKDKVQPYALPQLITFANDSEQIDLVVQISNFHHKEGGFWHSIRLGNTKQIQNSRERLVAVDLLLAGCFLILSVYHLVIYLLRKRVDRSALYFGIVGILFGGRILITDERYLLHLFPNLPWELTFRLEYLTLYLGFPFYMMFIRAVYPDEFSNALIRFIQILCFLLSLLVVLTPAVIFTETLVYTQFLMLGGGIYILFALLLAIYRKREAAKIFLFGFIVLFTAVTNDILHDSYLIDTGHFSSYGLLLFIFSQSFVLSIHYAHSFTQIEELSENLEQRIEERTKEITEQNIELEQQKKEITEQHKEIEKKNSNITASIVYASRIQQAILGSQDAVTSNFKESFILLEPKDIVSGDFYWFTEVKRSSSNIPGSEHKTLFFKVIAAADCTGHGIPGAFMTVMGNALLDEIINENRVTNPSKVLSLLDRKLLMKLQKHNVNDGMDVALLIFDDDNKKLSFSGANNPLYYVRNGEIHQIAGSKFPIGSTQYKIQKKFDLHTIDFEEGDVFYIFTDGFQDQFGGPEGRKYYKKSFREFLLKISDLPMKEQKQALKNELDAWKGNHTQTDDILVIGIRV